MILHRMISTGIAIYHKDNGGAYLEGVGSDLAVLHNRCLANGIDSIIDLTVLLFNT
jgi:hypothetical protein